MRKPSDLCFFLTPTSHTLIDVFICMPTDLLLIAFCKMS